jgi:hypothetical protein
MENLQWNETIQIDESIHKVETHDYEPQIGTDLNREHNDIKIIIQNQDQFLLPSESCLYIEGALTKEDGSNYNFKDDKISIINNGLMYLFDRVSYRIGNEEIEGYSYPGIATTLKGLTTYQRNSKENMMFFWSIDTKKNEKSNDGFNERSDYLGAADGQFNATIPLKHIFGFCENYDKVIYGVKHDLTLRRGDDANALFKTSDKDPNQQYKVGDGKITIKRLIWKMTAYKLSDEFKIKLYRQIKDKIRISIAYMNRQLEQTIMSPNQKFLDWTLTPSSGTQRPRYVILAFQTGKDNSQLSNNALFDHCNMKNAYIQLNNERYPEQNLQIDFDSNNYAVVYKMMIDYASQTNCAVAYKDYRFLHPIFVFDISRQNERLKDSPIDMKIKAEFNNNIPDNTHAYALILSDRIIQLQSDGEKMNINY